MVVKKLYGNSMKELLKQAKTQLGEDVVILSQKTLAGGRIELTVAIDPPQEDAELRRNRARKRDLRDQTDVALSGGRARGHGTRKGRLIPLPGAQTEGLERKDRLSGRARPHPRDEARRSDAEGRTSERTSAVLPFPHHDHSASGRRKDVYRPAGSYRRGEDNHDCETGFHRAVPSKEGEWAW